MDLSSPQPPATAFALKELKKFDHDRPMTLSRVSPCGRFVFAADYEAALHRWQIDGDAKVVLKGQHGGWIQGLVFHPDGKRMFTADSWGQLVAWNYADDAPAPLWKVADCHATWMRGLAISPDGATLATCGVDRFVRLWSTADGKLERELPRHAEELFSVAFHRDGKSLVAGDLKGNVTDWDLAAGTVTRRLDATVLYARPKVMGFTEINDVGGVRVLAFDAAGATLACGGSEPVTSGFFTGKPTVVLFDWTGGAKTQTLQPPDAQPSDGIVMDLQFHPQGYVVVATSGQPGAGAVWCWRPGEDKPFFHNKEMAHARSASLHADGKRLAVSQVAIKDGAGGGNGRGADKPEDYLGLVSRVRVFDTTGAGQS